MVRSQFHKRFMSCEFVRDAKASGFNFTCYKEKVEWDKLAQVDLDRVVRDVDIGALQDHINTIVRCDLGELRGVDTGLIKLFRLSQLCLEYCIFCQEQLALCQIELEDTHQQTLKELDSVKKELKLKKEELKKEIKKRKVTIKQEKENINTATFQCNMCPKVFQSLVFLESHVRRRHFEPSDKVTHDPSDAETKLHQEVEQLKLELEKQKDVLRAAVQEERESQLAQKEALWKKVEDAQIEQRARHQAEILDLTQTFQNQLKQSLTSQQSSSNSNNDTNVLNLAYQKQLTVLQDQLELKREMDVQAVEDMWKSNFDSLETRHHSELAKLHDQLKILQKQGDVYLAQLEAIKEEKNSSAKETEYQKDETRIKFVPKPARRRRHESKFKEFELSGDMTSKPENTSASPKSTPPPPLLPRKKLQYETTPIMNDKTTVDMSSTPIAPVRRSKLKSETRTQMMHHEISSSDEESDHEEVNTLQDMKAALKQNPEILHSLREDVAAHVDVKFAELGIDHDLKGISHQDFTRIGAIISRHRKLNKKKYKSYENIREGLEEIIKNRMTEMEVVKENRVSHESNIKPSKIKRTGFLAKLTQYHKKSKKKSAEPVMHTSTPLKNTDTETSRTPQSILKLSKEQLWSGEQSTKSEPSTPSPIGRRVLERAQSSESLPPPKSVTFATASADENLSLSSSWDDDIPQQENKEFATTQSSQNIKSDFQQAQKELNEQLMLAFQTSSSAQLQSKKPSSNDNSWDLEDL